MQVASITLAVPPGSARPLGVPHAPSSVFVGRDGETRALLDLFAPGGGTARRGRVALVTGPAGVGKSEPLLQAAHGAYRRGWFPGGVLSIDLRGYATDLPPLTPGEALGRLLHRLGLPLDAVPEHAEDRAAAYRDRAVLVLLDNARDSAQVRPLLPPDGCAALTASRHRLPALDDVHRLELTALPPEQSCELFLAAAHPEKGTGRSAALPHARRIAAHCGRLPLALRVAAARVREEPAEVLAEFASWLDDEGNRLLELDDGERAVTVSFRASYDRLDDGQRLLFALCGLHPGTRLDIRVVAALADLPARDVRRGIRELRDAHLVDTDGARRYRLHDLLHAYARTRAHEDLAEETVSAALDRLIDCYLCTADCADLAVAPGRYRLPHNVARTPHSTPDVAGREAALAGFADELPQLTAFVRTSAAGSDPSRCWILADAMRGFFFHAKAWDAWLETLQVTLDAATGAGEPRVQGILHNSMGVALIELGRSQEAARHYDEARARFELAGDAHGMAASVENRAWVYQYAGDHGAALADHQQALDVYRALGARRITALVQRGMALAEMELGRYEEAAAHLTEALDMFLALGLGLELDAAMALNGLGEGRSKAGDVESARRYFLRGLRRSRACGSPFEEARARDGLGGVLAATDPRRAARGAPLAACAVALPVPALPTRRRSPRPVVRTGTSFREPGGFSRRGYTNRESWAMGRLSACGDQVTAMSSYVF
ncbi:tetratricopeptide repeat protein [Streptomyces sp. NPDC087305]|uniref:tetratricopeptide repeat protein n=1 Tax=Streptomyces sp. NPDC087305 TaxID=3365781 RepID=UPI0037F39A82